MIYHYICPTHGEFEHSHSMATHTNIMECPQCNTPSPQVITGGQATHFKGSNWASKKIPEWKGPNKATASGETYIK